MPVHDWKTVDAGIFHAFHHNWIAQIAAALNRGLLPSDYYALPEQIAGGKGPDVLTLQSPSAADESSNGRSGTIALADASPKVAMRFLAETDQYAAKAKAVVIRHISGHQGIHKAVWDEFIDDGFELPSGKPLTLAAYRAAEVPEAFVQPIAVGDTLIAMPLFLHSEEYIDAPLEPAYPSAFADMPAYWRDVLKGH